MKGLKGMKKMKKMEKMKKMNQELKNRDQGFTLIELIIVIAILAIIAAIAIPNIMGAIEKSKKTADIANGKVIANVVGQVAAEGATISGTIAMENVKETAAADSLEKKLYIALNGGVPVPKYNPATNKQFYVTYVGNKLSVFVGPAGANPTGGVEVYPTPSGDYAK